MLERNIGSCLKLSLSNNQCTNLSVPKISLVSLKTSCAKCCLRPSDDWSFALEVTVDDAVGFDGRRRYLSGLKSLNLPLWWWWHRYATPPRKGALLIWPSQHFRNFLPLLVRTWNWLKLNPRSLPYLAWFLWPPRVYTSYMEAPSWHWQNDWTLQDHNYCLLLFFVVIAWPCPNQDCFAIKYSQQTTLPVGSKFSALVILKFVQTLSALMPNMASKHTKASPLQASQTK